MRPALGRIFNISYTSEVIVLYITLCFHFLYHLHPKIAKATPIKINSTAAAIYSLTGCRLYRLPCVLCLIFMILPLALVNFKLHSMCYNNSKK